MPNALKKNVGSEGYNTAYLPTLKAVKGWAGGLSDFDEMDRDRWEAIGKIENRLREKIGIQSVGDLPLKVSRLHAVDNPFVFLMEMEKEGLLDSLDKSKGRVLDFSSGLGRNALYLMKKGFDVLSVAYHPEEANFQEKWADRYKKRFQGCGNLEIRGGAFEIPNLDGERFSMVICVNSLQNVSREKGRIVVENLKASTLPGGLNLIATFNLNDKYIQERAGDRRYTSFISSGEQDDELQRLYEKGWTQYGSSPDIARNWSFNPRIIRRYSVVMAKKE